MMNSQTNDVPLAIKIKAFCTLSKKGSPNIYKLPITEVGCDRKIKLRMCEIGEPSFPKMTEKIVIMLGATGSGKTTVINGIANYIYGVQWEHDFRFKVITEDDEGGASKNNQAYSQTKYITSYTFHHQQGFPLPYSVTLIDSPGFGDTEGIKRDEETVKQIKALFERKGNLGIDHLNAVGFVVPSPNARLTYTQQYIVDSILSVFGKDVIDNIFILATFCDGGKPQVLDGLKAANVMYKAFFKFNNSALFSENKIEDDDDNFEKMFWKIGIKSYRLFFDGLNTTPSKSLQMTRDVLKERENLEISIQGLQNLIQVGLSKLEELRKEEMIIHQFEAEIEANKDFTYQINLTKQRKIDLNSGEYVTNCLKCNDTCHYPCYIPKDEDKLNCAAMKDEFCTVCPEKCKWDIHVNNTYRFELYQEKETRTSQDLKDKFFNATASKSKIENMINNLNNQFEDIEKGVCAAIASARGSINKLNKIAAKTNPLSVVDYIDLLIKSEERAGNPGFKDRITHLEEAKKKAQFIQNINDPNFDPWKEYNRTKKGQKKWYQWW